MSARVTRSGEQFATLDNGLSICHETFGSKRNPAVLLIMGLGGPMTWWRADFCEKLAARGFYVIRMDNRDTGRSSRVGTRVRRPDVVRAYLTGRGTPPYTLADMADDCIGVLDHLHVKQAHIVGVSMGGMIAQTLVIGHPERALSLVSIMSTTGRRTVGWQHPKLLANLMRPVRRGRENFIEESVRSHRLISSPAYPLDEEYSRQRAAETWERGWSGSGVLRQIMAISAAHDRTAALGELDLPVTVIHGMKDPLVHRSGGRATADAIRGADLIEVGGLAHDLPPALDEVYIEAIARTAARAG